MQPPFGVYPIVVSIGRPPSIAHRLAPWPRCATTVRPDCRSPKPGDDELSTTGRGSRSGAGPDRRARGAARSARDLRQVAMECGVEARHLGQLGPVRAHAPHDVERRRKVERASGTRRSSEVSSASPTRSGPTWSRPPWTTRCPTASGAPSGERASASRITPAASRQSSGPCSASPTGAPWASRSDRRPPPPPISTVPTARRASRRVETVERDLERRGADVEAQHAHQASLHTQSRISGMSSRCSRM